MVSISVDLANISGTEAALGWAGSHTLVADRPDGKAGGKGLGFNGGELLALALGGCFCNDLRYVAHADGVALGRIGVHVSLELEGDPLVATSARLEVDLETSDSIDPAEVIDRARSICTVANSVARGFPVKIEQSAQGS